MTSNVCQLQLNGALCKRCERSTLGSELCTLWPGQLRQPSSCSLASAPTPLCSTEEKDREKGLAQRAVHNTSGVQVQIHLLCGGHSREIDVHYHFVEHGPTMAEQSGFRLKIWWSFALSLHGPVYSCFPIFFPRFLAAVGHLGSAFLLFCTTALGSSWFRRRK